MTAGTYIDQILPRIEQIRLQSAAIEAAARMCAQSIVAGNVVHVFGAGHSRMMAEEAYPRIGAIVGFHPVVELAVTFFHQVVGVNGLRQTLFLERVPGYGELIFNELDARPQDSVIVFSSSGVEAIIVDFALAAKKRGNGLVGVTSFAYSAQAAAERGGATLLRDIADVVIDNGVPPGDAIVQIEGLSEPVAPSASILNLTVMNEITTATARELVALGVQPMVFSSPHLVGAEASQRRFDECLAEYRKRVWRRE